MTSHLFYFRPGEEARMLARCQFTLGENRSCGAIFTYPIKGYPWRRNVMRNYMFPISNDTKELLFAEVHRIRHEYPEECLSNHELWSDSSEKGNGITRDRATGTLCYSIAIYRENSPPEEQYALRENSKALLNSSLYKIVSELIKPYDKLRKEFSGLYPKHIRLKSAA